MSLRALRGMNDILPADITLWQEIEAKARSFFARYGYGEIRTPVLEEMGLFTRSIGDTTNIVEKEMYVFQDKGDKWIAMRPEGTASVVRAYVEHNLSQEDPGARFYYMGPMYRHERPQKGRYRQFYQIGCEVFGVSSARLDAEVIHMADRFFRELGLTEFSLEINSLGCTICRPKFMSAFFGFLHQNEERLCGDCKRRMERNPLRALDCNQEGCRQLTDEGPSIQDFLCETCEKDFDQVIVTLGALKTPHKINPKIVRGLDYYQKTTFEFSASEGGALGTQNAIAGGGRYDGLVRLLGGPNVAGFGFALGMERLVEVLRASRPAPQINRQGIFLAALGEKALAETMKIASQLRGAGITVEMEYEDKSLKSQMRRADKMGARYVAILGDQELAKKTVMLKDLVAGSQEETPLTQLESKLKS